ncbi:hypothetical protein [Streptomyces mobaraensis]
MCRRIQAPTGRFAIPPPYEPALNDRAETAAIKRAFGSHSCQVAITAPKSVSGHACGACGVLESVGVLRSMRETFVAPTANLENPYPDLDYTPWWAGPPRSTSPSSRTSDSAAGTLRWSSAPRDTAEHPLASAPPRAAAPCRAAESRRYRGEATSSGTVGCRGDTGCPAGADGVAPRAGVTELVDHACLAHRRQRPGGAPQP